MLVAVFLVMLYRYAYVPTLVLVTRLVFTMLLRLSGLWPPRFGEPRWHCFAALDCTLHEVIGAVERAWILSVVVAAFLVGVIVAHCVLGAPLYLLRRHVVLFESHLACLLIGILVGTALTLGVPVEEWAWSRHWLPGGH